MNEQGPVSPDPFTAARDLESHPLLQLLEELQRDRQELRRHSDNQYQQIRGLQIDLHQARIVAGERQDEVLRLERLTDQLRTTLEESQLQLTEAKALLARRQRKGTKK